MDQIKFAIEKEDYTQFFKIFNELRLESANNDKIIEKAISKFESKKMFNELYNMLMRIAKYPLSALEYELKEGLRILTNNKYNIIYVEKSMKFLI